jgi:DNA replication protein DnaC
MTLEEKLRQLSLTTMAQTLETISPQAVSQNLNFSAALERLADLELEASHRRAIQRRFKLSRLPAQPTLDQFHFAHDQSRLQAKNRILHLLDLDFLKQGTSVVIIGNPGVGKTFLAQILGWRACQAQVRVLFTTAMDMLNQLLASRSIIPWCASSSSTSNRPSCWWTNWDTWLSTRRLRTFSTRSFPPVTPTRRAP